MQSGQAFLNLEKPDSLWQDQAVKPFPGSTVTVAAGQTIQQALRSLDLTLPQAAVALVNGSTCDLNYVLQPGDTVRFLLQISGG